MNKFICWFASKISLGIIVWALFFYARGQNSGNTIFWDQLISVEKDTTLSTNERLNQVRVLKKKFEDGKLPVDSVYARILHRIGVYEYLLNNKVATKEAITLTLAAVRINSAGKKNNSITFCINSYTNLAGYYKSLHMYDLSLLYADSALILRKQYYVPLITIPGLMLDKAHMLYRNGDYERAIEEIDMAVVNAKENKDSSKLAVLLNQRAQSNIMQNRLEEALRDVSAADNFAKLFDNPTEIISSMLIKGDILAKKKEYSKVVELYQNGISSRIQTNDYTQVADDYTDFGNFYLNDLKNYSRAKDCYQNVIKYALLANDFERLSKAHNNLEQCSFKQKNYKEASAYCAEALNDLKATPGNKNILNNPLAVQLGFIGNKELILFILGNKTELLLALFKQTKDTNYLAACLRTALLTDTIITNTRHEQLGEQSKLFWRNKTREFFTDAMEACYLANNIQLAFYFMEKSRAVLLNDKLNEIGASAHLPQAEAAIEQQFQIVAISAQQKLSSFNINDTAYEVQLSKLAQAKADLEHYIKSLEKKYPSYYQYRYSDEVITLNELKTYLLKNNETFVHYFMNDTVTYIISVTPGNAKMIRLLKNDFRSGMLIDFLRLSADQPALNNHYDSFASLSFTLYKLLFQPLNIPRGRVIICPDNFAIPFEALCTDAAGDNFLVENYIFSYVYSARFLMTKYNVHQVKGDFIGFAPVTFDSYKDVANLIPSDEALKRSAGFYNNKSLYTNKSANRRNFLNLAPNYSIVNVFSHAFADTTEIEPVLYMHDSIISLSELQLLHNPATQLVVLSACETVAGRSAKGEGILSLARGFASVGIPAVAATLWQADEQTIYEISEKFHEYLSQGSRKDEALQKAKLYFLKNCDKQQRLPFYWSNIILVGNADPLQLAASDHSLQWIAAILLTVIFAFAIFYYLKKRMP